jgi:methanogenic corrinoid protein MtbC1
MVSSSRATDAAAVSYSDDALAPRLTELFDAAAAYVNDELFRSYASAKVKFSAFGRQHTIGDLHDHLGFLRGAIAMQEPWLFAEYMRWRKQTAIARGLPLQPLREALDLLALFFRARLAPDEAGRVIAVLAAGLGELDSPDDDPLGDLLPEDDVQTLPESRPLARALLDGDTEAVRNMAFDLLRRVLDYPALVTRLFQPALYHVGNLWERNQVSVSQEHQATALAQAALGDILQTASFAPRTERRAVFAGIEGNLHSVGPRVIADTFELAGWSVTFLGANASKQTLLETSDRERPTLIGLSVSLTEQLPTAISVIEALRAELGATCPSLMVGGLATNSMGGLWRGLRADAWCRNAEQAYEIAA